jgi:hypothetical protein
MQAQRGSRGTAQPYVIPGFRREVNENCAPQSYYTVSSSNFFTKGL